MQIATAKKPVDLFYPIDERVGSAAREVTLEAIALEITLRQHFAAAVAGDSEQESWLVNGIGQIRRSVPQMSQCSLGIQQTLREAVAWLRSVGRTVDLANPNPALWVSRRGGGPRW